MTDCSTDPQGRTALKQKLLVRRGNCDPITVAEVDAGAPQLDPFGVCRGFGEGRNGRAALDVGLFERLAVLPDGSGVVFEVTSRWSPFQLRPAEEGFFFVRSDGRGLRRLGPPSRVRVNPGNNTADNYPVSPDGRYIALLDLGPDSFGQDDYQIFRLDTRTGRRRQLTHHSGNTCCQSFLNNETVIFYDIQRSAVMVKVDGEHPEKRLPVIMLSGGGSVVSLFEVTGAHPFPFFVYFNERPAVNGSIGVSELFLLDGGKNPFQLTNFGRNDTDRFSGVIARGRVLFPASVNLGENPHEICQLFSIDMLGAHVRQVTHLPSDDRAPNLGCLADVLVPGTCHISRLFRDPITGTVLFASSCDPVGANPFGDQLFAMRLDGTGLRQLTNARGMTTDPDGTIHVELPGPVGYPFSAK